KAPGGRSKLRNQVARVSKKIGRAEKPASRISSKNLWTEKDPPGLQFASGRTASGAQKLRARARRASDESRDGVGGNGCTLRITSGRRGAAIPRKRNPAPSRTSLEKGGFQPAFFRAEGSKAGFSPPYLTPSCWSG